MSLHKPTKDLKKIGLGALLASLSLSTVQADLLGVIPAEPLFKYNSGGTTTFDSATGTVVVNATPFEFTPAGGAPLIIYPLGTSPTVLTAISLDTDCNLVGGDPGGDDLTVSGDIDINGDFVPEYTGVLLTGEVVGFGTDTNPLPSSALFDTRFVITGGALVGSGDYVLGAEIGMTLTVEANNFTGDCSADWSGGAKGNIGSVETIEPPVEACYGVKKVSIRDGKKHWRHWGSHGSSGSKVKVGINATCPDDFNPANELITLSLDGETFSFNPGAFNQVGSTDKYRAWVGGSPTIYAVLNCADGEFSFSARRADVSQVDNSDGVDVTLELGTWSQSEVVSLANSGHHWWNWGHNNVLYYNNYDVEQCGLPDDDTDHHEVKCRNKHSGKIFSFSKSRYNLGKSIFAHDANSGHSAVFDTSKNSTLTCGDEDAAGNWEIVGVSHSDGNKDCTILSEEEEDDDVEDNVHD
jgi:hypothetical protein